MIAKHLDLDVASVETTEIAGDLLERAPGAIVAAREETEGVPDDLAAAIERRLAQLRASD